MKRLFSILFVALLGIVTNVARPGCPSFRETFEDIYGVSVNEAVLMERTTSKSLLKSLDRMIANGYDSLIVKYSALTNLDRMLVMSLICQETEFMTTDTDSSTHRGLMQLSGTIAAEYGITDLSDPRQNIEAGTKYLKDLMNIFREDGFDSTNTVKFALAAYNCGIGRIRSLMNQAAVSGMEADNLRTFEAIFRNPAGPTRRYVNSIIYRYKRCKKIF